MFTGIVECLGQITEVKPENGNVHFSVKSPFFPELKIDQSIAHNGACLTVVALENEIYTVTAIAETLQRTNLKNLKKGDEINLERCAKLGDRLDGHLVQGHVDAVGKIANIQNENGSWKFWIAHEPGGQNFTVEKGSITINGVSLTVVDSEKDQFSVAIIPYTFENTVFRNLKVGDLVNLEFDVIGKYVARIMERRG